MDSTRGRDAIDEIGTVEKRGNVDTIEKMRRAVMAAVAEPIRALVEETVGSIIDQRLRATMQALQDAPWPTPKRGPGRPRKVAAEPEPPPPAAKPEPKPDRAGRTRFKVPAMPLVEERHNGRTTPRKEEPKLHEEGGAAFYEGRIKRKQSTAPDPVDGYRRPVKGARDYSAGETLGGLGVEPVPAGVRLQRCIAWLKEHGQGTYIDLAPVAYPEVGDTNYSRKLSSINCSQWCSKGYLERVPNTYRPTFYRIGPEAP